jgi:hypothetical protein
VTRFERFDEVANSSSASSFVVRVRDLSMETALAISTTPWLSARDFPIVVPDVTVDLAGQLVQVVM